MSISDTMKFRGPRHGHAVSSGLGVGHSTQVAGGSCNQEAHKDQRKNATRQLDED